MLDRLREIVGDKYVLTGSETARWDADISGRHVGPPAAVVRPASTAEVSAILKLCNDTGTAVVPVSGNTGLNGGAVPQGGVQLSLDRMNRIREIRPSARIAIVEAGVVLETLHAAAEAHGLKFPMTFGAKGSAMIGGMLGTNAGGSNVLRYGNMRDLCLGLEVVLADGRVLNMMRELHKDNSGYDLRHLMIGSEGTLGVITGAVLKLVPAPRAYATAMVAAPGLPQALELLNRLQMATGGDVEAFEYMPGSYIDDLCALKKDVRPPFDRTHDVNILLELGSTVEADAVPGPDGSLPIVTRLEEILGAMFEEGAVLDAVVAQNEAQRREMWVRRESAAEVSFSRSPLVDNDIAVPVDRVAEFLTRADAMAEQLSPGTRASVVSHLGDGNVHYMLWPTSQDPEVHDQLKERVEEIVLDLGGSFSAEHGIGLAKLKSMKRRKDPVQVAVMRSIKAALDPNGILNPGKLLP